MSTEQGAATEIGELIHSTLANAARAPYYAKTWGDAWKDIVTVEQLATLPLLDKQTAILNQRDLVVGDRPPGFGIASSGTTRTADLPALNILRTPEEHAAIRGDGVDEPDPNDPFPGWTLVAVGVHHGLPMTPPGRDEIFIPWSYHRNALSMLEACLSEPQPDGRRVTAMRISAGALKTFTMWLLENGKDPSTFGVKMIGTNGSRLSGRWRDIVSSSFGGVKLYDNFSLSEIPTPATECKACNTLHWGWPPLIWEVLDVETGKPVEEGVGKLVVTTPYPWVQKMPLIRYDTGDVVSLGPPCDATGEPRMEYLGRFRRGVVVPGQGFQLPPARVQDVLEAMRDTERNPHPAVTNGLVKSRELGLPRWTAELEEGIAHLKFEARFDPLVFPKTARSIEEHVANELGGGMAVTACAPGSLNPPGDKFE
jgi:hypothetical protein